MTVTIRQVHDDDLDLFYEIQDDHEVNDLAKVYPRSREDFDAFWDRIRSDETVIIRSIELDGELMGNINSYTIDNDRYIGYWIHKKGWGKGIASSAVSQFLQIDQARPMHARVAEENIGSIRVLEKCGFIKTGEAQSPEDDRFMACIEHFFRLDY